MNPIKLTNETRDIGKPANWNEEVHGPCKSLSVHDYVDENGLPWMISRWMPTEAEVQLLIEGGSAQLHIGGTIHPAVALQVL